MHQHEYNMAVEAIRTGQLSDADPNVCFCKGCGWILTDFDTWEECPSHRGHPHPEDDSDYETYEDTSELSEVEVTSDGQIDHPEDDIPF